MPKTSIHRISTGSLSLIVNIMFWLMVAGLAIGIPAGVATTVASDNPLSLPATVSAESLGELPWDVKDGDRAAVDLPISDLSTAQVVVFHSNIAVGGLVIVFALWKLRQLVRSVREGDPFTDANVGRLRTLGSLMLFAYPIVQFVTARISEWIITTNVPDVPTAVADVNPFSLGALFGGLCLLVLAEVFAHGIRLREDVEGTV